jgi:hypothetical protein
MLSYMNHREKGIIVFSSEHGDHLLMALRMGYNKGDFTSAGSVVLHTDGGVWLGGGSLTLELLSLDTDREDFIKESQA